MWKVGIDEFMTYIFQARFYPANMRKSIISEVRRLIKALTLVKQCCCCYMFNRLTGMVLGKGWISLLYVSNLGLSLPSVPRRQEGNSKHLPTFTPSLVGRIVWRFSIPFVILLRFFTLWSQEWLPKVKESHRKPPPALAWVGPPSEI